MSLVYEKDVLSQGFDEQISNLIITADVENLNLPMIDMFTKMMIGLIDMLCVRAELGRLASSKAPALSFTELMRCITDNLDIMIPDLCHQVHAGDHMS